MSHPILQLGDDDLRELAVAIAAGRLRAPFTALGLGRIVPASIAQDLASELQRLADAGLGGGQLSLVLDLLLADRARRPPFDHTIDLVTTGPDAPGVVNRDTSVVVRELFSQAQHSVLLAGYAVYQGQQVFRALADRMQEHPELQVRLFLDISRGPADTTVAGDLVRRFADRFKTRQWPKDRPLPEVFYDPRALDLSADQRACLHAKCIVVDREAVFVSSANFTEAAQERNIEVGLLVRSAVLADQIVRHFEVLLASTLLHRVL
ncbi:MAG TPA: DISARM system phospholipase D-like protein DrmC [Pirellulales bacterium]|nr:DISARM system phospholipase D-like protein DrmC [Pirellulales bacterium]